MLDNADKQTTHPRTHAHAYGSLGQLQLREGQWEGAERSFRRAYDLLRPRMHTVLDACSADEKNAESMELLQLMKAIIHGLLACFDHLGKRRQWEIFSVKQDQLHRFSSSKD
jgi:Tfp pilus assembly protein PilF